MRPLRTRFTYIKRAQYSFDKLIDGLARGRIMEQTLSEDISIAK